MTEPITLKHAGDNVPFSYDWKVELAKLGDTYITESHWNVDVGTMVIGSDGRVSDINGSVTRCFIQGGTPDEYCVLNNSILLNKVTDPDTGDKLVQRFIVHIIDGDWEPMTPPVIILPDGIPNLTLLEAFRGGTPGVSVWVDVTTAYPTGTLYFAVPQGTFPLSGESVIAGQLIDWVEINYLNGGGTGVPLSRRLYGTAPIRIDGGDFGDLAANRTISLSIGGANQVIASDGTTDAWTTMTDPIHGARGGGTQHALVTINNAGFAPGPTGNNFVLMTLVGGTVTWQKIKAVQIDNAAGILAFQLASGGANQVITSNGTTNSWGSVTDAMITSLAWSKITSTPTTLSGYGITDGVNVSRTISTTGPLTGGGALSSNLTLGISAATTSNSGSMSASDKLKLDALNIAGTVNTLAKFTSANGVGNSNVSDNGSTVFVTKDSTSSDSAVDVGQLIVRGASNNNLRLAMMVDTTKNIGMVQAGISGTGEVPLSLNPKGSSVGIGTSTPRNQLSVVSPYNTSDSVPAVGAPGGKFSILNDGGGTPSTSGNYGLLFGALANGDGFIQEQRVDGIATLYNLLLQPNGGFVGIGTTNPTATLHTNGTLGIDAIALQPALGVARELVQACDIWGSQIISRHGGGFGDQAITYVNLAASSTKAPKQQKYNSPFTTSSPGTYTQNISLLSYGTMMPANRSFMATMKITQHVDTIITSGYSMLTLITGHTDTLGRLVAIYITGTPMVAGTGTAPPTVTVAVVSDTVFSFSVANTWTGTITGYWEMEVAWVGP